MAAKKTATPTGKKKTAKTAKKTANKTEKKTAKKTAKKTGKKTAKKAAKKVAPKAAAKKAAKPAAEKKSAGKPTVSTLTVNMSHVFALRPRAITSFKAGDFSTAKHQLQDEIYADIHAAAKAVVEKALELTHGSPKRGRKGRF